jgi:hypothetical protein
VTTKNGHYYLKQNLLEKDVGVAIIFKARPFHVSFSFVLFGEVCFQESKLSRETLAQYRYRIFKKNVRFEKMAIYG